MTKLDVAHLAKFNNIEIIIGTGPGFLDGPDYVALVNSLHTFRAAVIKENENRVHPMTINFRWDHYYPDTEDVQRVDQIFRSQKLELARNTIQWPFQFLEKVNCVEEVTDIEGHWNFEQDENEPEQSGRWFWMNNWALGTRGFAIVDVVDENESEMTEDESEIDPQDEDDEEIPDLLDGDLPDLIDIDLHSLNGDSVVDDSSQLD